jgi:hypothetical protein
VNANPDPQLKDLVPATPIVTRSFARTQTLTPFAEVYDNASTLAHDLMLVATVRDANDSRRIPRAGPADRRLGLACRGIHHGHSAEGFRARCVRASRRRDVCRRRVRRPPQRSV